MDDILSTSHWPQAENAVAVVDGVDVYDVRELRRDAEHLAARLEATSPDLGPVLVMLPRSYAHVVAFFACIRAGRVYEPIDHNLPPNRAKLLLRHLSPQLVMTAADASVPGVGWHQGHLGEPERIEVANTAVVLHKSTNSCRQLVGPGYVISTSGSSGMPKSVHVGVTQLKALADAVRTLPIASTDRCLWGAPPSFDASIFELLLAFTNGAPLVLRSEGEPHEAAIGRMDATVAVVTPSVLQSMRPGESRLRIVFSVGELLTRSLASRWMTKVHLYNLYGPTEASIWTTQFDVTADGLGLHSSYVPIGTPVGQNKIGLSDAEGQVCRVNQVGEIQISGPHVARGYLDDERSGGSGFERLDRDGGDWVYNTGDRAVDLGDGNLIALGRSDDQIKIMGSRIELGEIREVVERLWGVNSAVVVSDESKRRFGVLVQMREINADTRGSILRSISEELPKYMIPERLEVVESIPLLPSGKVDTPACRRILSLDAPSTRRVGGDELDDYVRSLWIRLLHVETIRDSDNFFSLGGHSLLAAKETAEVREALNREVPLTLLFEAPSFHSYVEALRGILASSRGLESDGL